MKTAFYKTNVFKCFAIVVSVLLACGVLLAILSDVLKVSAEEQAKRAMTKIYGDSSLTAETVQLDKNYNNNLGVVKTVYSISNGDYLLLVTGKQGFSNGTVTIWLAFKTQPELSVYKAVYADNKGQSLIAKIGGIYDTYLNKDTFDGVNNDLNYKDNIQSGASYSSKATNNAVRVGTNYVKTVLLKEGV